MITSSKTFFLLVNKSIDVIPKKFKAEHQRDLTHSMSQSEIEKIESLKAENRLGELDDIVIKKTITGSMKLKIIKKYDEILDLKKKMLNSFIEEVEYRINKLDYVRDKSNVAIKKINKVKQGIINGFIYEYKGKKVKHDFSKDASYFTMLVYAVDYIRTLHDYALRDEMPLDKELEIKINERGIDLEEICEKIDPELKNSNLLAFSYLTKLEQYSKKNPAALEERIEEIKAEIEQLRKEADE